MFYMSYEGLTLSSLFFQVDPSCTNMSGYLIFFSSYFSILTTEFISLFLSSVQTQAFIVFVKIPEYLKYTQWSQSLY